MADSDSKVEYSPSDDDVHPVRKDAAAVSSRDLRGHPGKRLADALCAASSVWEDLTR